MRNLTDPERVCIAFLRSIGYSRQDVADIVSRGTRTVTRTTGELHFTKQERKNTKTIQQVLEKIRTNDTDDLERPMPGQQVFEEFREPEPEDDRLKLVVGEKPREKKHISFADAYAAYEQAGLRGEPVPQLWVDYIKQEGFLPEETERDIVRRFTGGRVTAVDAEQDGGFSVSVEKPNRYVTDNADPFEIDSIRKAVDDEYKKIPLAKGLEPLRDLIRAVVREELEVAT